MLISRWRCPQSAQTFLQRFSVSLVLSVIIHCSETQTCHADAGRLVCFIMHKCWRRARVFLTGCGVALQTHSADVLLASDHSYHPLRLVGRRSGSEWRHLRCWETRGYHFKLLNMETLVQPECEQEPVSLFSALIFIFGFHEACHGYNKWIFFSVICMAIYTTKYTYFGSWSI